MRKTAFCRQKNGVLLTACRPLSLTGTKVRHRESTLSASVRLRQDNAELVRQKLDDVQWQQFEVLGVLRASPFILEFPLRGTPI